MNHATFDAATVDKDAQCYVGVRIQKRHPGILCCNDFAQMPSQITCNIYVLMRYA